MMNYPGIYYGVGEEALKNTSARDYPANRGIGGVALVYAVSEPFDPVNPLAEPGVTTGGSFELTIPQDQATKTDLEEIQTVLLALDVRMKRIEAVLSCIWSKLNEEGT
jgi:hypothetical protein